MVFRLCSTKKITSTTNSFWFLGEAALQTGSINNLDPFYWNEKCWDMQMKHFPKLLGSIFVPGIPYKILINKAFSSKPTSIFHWNKALYKALKSHIFTIRMKWGMNLKMLWYRKLQSEWLVTKLFDSTKIFMIQWLQMSN